MQVDDERIDLARHQIFGRGHRMPLRAVEAGAGDAGHPAVGRHIGEAHEPVGQRRIGRRLQAARAAGRESPAILGERRES